MNIARKAQERSVRTLMVSDVHLGCRFAQADHFLTYISGVRPEQLFILGDFFDGWKLRSRWRWTTVYFQIIDRLFELAESGTELYYTPGNHDDFLRRPEVAGFLVKSGVHVNVRDEFVYETLDGRRLLAFHGDMTYINTGDWVENCTALVERSNGELVLESFFADQAAAYPREAERSAISSTCTFARSGVSSPWGSTAIAFARSTDSCAVIWLVIGHAVKVSI